MRVNALAIWRSMVDDQPTESKAATRKRADGRRSLLVYMDADLIKRLKKTALDHERNAYDIVEEAVRDWFSKRRDG